MPELAEIETLMRYLKKRVINFNITQVRLERKKLRYVIDPDLTDNSIGAKIIDVQRRAKFLHIKLSNQKSIIFHLGMSGTVTLQDDSYQIKKHDHAIFKFQNNGQMIFNDPRRFGMIYTCDTDNFEEESFLKNMGVEPLTNEFNTEYLFSVTSHRKIPIKNLIMDSKTVVGVGNIYAAESLFQSKIRPDKLSNEVSLSRVKLLVIAIKEILEKAIKAGGTTLKDFVGGDNKPGYFKQDLKIYGRAGEKCYDCNHIIENIKLSGRSSFFCSNCQK